MNIVRTFLMIMMIGFIGSCGDSMDVENSESGQIMQECDRYYGIITEASDGARFKVLIVYDGRIDFETIYVAANGTQVVPVAEAVGVGGGVGVGGQFVSPVDARFFPDPQRKCGIFVSPVNSDDLCNNYRWAWIDDINAEDVEATVDVLCPPWH